MIGFTLRQGIGFFIQVMPAVILSYLPLSETAFHGKKGAVLLTTFLYTLLASAAFPFVLFSPIREVLRTVDLCTNLYMLLVLAASVCFYLYVVREQMRKKLTILFLVLLYGSTQFVLVNFLMLLGSLNVPDEAYGLPVLLLYLGTGAVLFPLSAVGMRRVIKPYLDKIDFSQVLPELRVIVAVSSLYLAALFMISSAHQSAEKMYRWIIFPVALFVVAVLCVFYWYMFRDSVQRTKREQYRRMADIQSVQYDNLVKEMENARRIRHDMRYHLQVLDYLLKEEPQRAQTYLTDLLDQTKQSTTKVYCANPVVNGILRYYAQRASEEGISFFVQADCPADLSVRPLDLTVVLGNICENALCACKALPKDRQIDLQIGLVGSSLMIQAENSAESVTLLKKYADTAGFLPGEAFVSKKEDGGFGLGSIDLAVKQYDGDALFSFDAGQKRFMTRVRINLHPESLKERTSAEEGGF